MINSYFHRFLHLLLLIFLSLFLSLFSTAYSYESPKVKDGVIDLSSWRGETINLDGNWNFSWKKFLKPGEKGEELIKVPSSWPKRFQKRGFGTYVLLVKGLKKGNGIRINRNFSAASFYAGEKLIYSSGKPGKNEVKEVPDFSYHVATLPEGTFPLIIHISNHSYRNGKLTELTIGNYERLREQLNFFRLSEFFLMGILFVMGFYYLVIYNQRRQDTTAFYFSILCLIILARTMINGYHINLFFEPSKEFFDLLVRINYITISFIPIVFLFYAASLFKDTFPKKIIKWFLIYALLLLPFNFFLPVFHQTDVLFRSLNELIIIATIIVISYQGFVWIKSKAPFSKPFTISLSFLIFAALYDLAVGKVDFLPPYQISPVFFISFIFTQSYILSVKFSKALSDSEYLVKLKESYAHDLENQVKEKTKSIKGLVENLGQGFMVIDHKGIVQEGATEITKEFFRVKPEGKNLSEVLKLGKEKKDLFEKWLQNIWRGVLSFKDLKELGPQSYEVENRYIDLDYRAIYKEGSGKKVDKVICIATDKTRQVNLENQLELDKQQAAFITSCLQNPVDFVDLMEDTQDLLNDYSKIKNEDKGELFRKFHTLKARYGQFGVKRLTYYINEVETAISKEGKDLDTKVDTFDKEVDDFTKENRLIIEAANKFMVDDGHALQITQIMEKINESESLDDLQFELYKNYLLTDIKEKFSRYKNLVMELGEENGKVLDMNLTGDKVLVEYARFANFINICVHLFRNMVDHGIETEDERIEKSKPQKGSIIVDFKNNEDSFIICFKDDGRGIDPEKIKSKALNQGILIEKDLEGMSEEDLLGIIFHPGFSTKEEVSDVSGRGVGMDAVKEEVLSLGGTISVKSTVDQGTTFLIELPILS